MRVVRLERRRRRVGEKGEAEREGKPEERRN